METLQTHFYFSDESVHSIKLDTFLTCERSLRNSVQHIAKTLGVKVEVEILALKEGGVVSDLAISVKESPIASSIITGVVSGVIGGIIVHMYTSDPEQANMQKALSAIELAKHVDNGNVTLEQIVQSVEELNPQKLCVFKEMAVLQKQCSVFYEALDDDGSVEKVSISKAINRAPIEEDKHTVSKPEFGNYIRKEEKIERTEKFEEIEIIAPVIKKSNYKWRGIYDDRYINFGLLDKDFKSDVYQSLYSFETGSRLYAELRVRSIVDDEGELKDVEYDVIKVYEYYQPSTRARVKTKAGQERDAEKSFDAPKQEKFELISI